MATDTEEEGKRKRLLLLLLLLIETMEDETNVLVGALSIGTIHPATFGQRMAVTLTAAHANAAYLGRVLAGATQPMGHNDILFGQSVTQQQQPFLDGFVADLQSGRYTEEGVVSEAAVLARAKLYSKALLGTANEAWSLTLPAGTLIYWHLNVLAAEVHCHDCPRLEKEGPYLVDDLPTVPGRGDTECLGNCYCFLSTANGKVGFNLKELQ